MQTLPWDQGLGGAKHPSDHLHELWKVQNNNENNSNKEKENKSKNKNHKHGYYQQNWDFFPTE
jgi:hypothetical protein